MVGPSGLVTHNAAYCIMIFAQGRTTVTLADVLIGDVWFCSGPSNLVPAGSTDVSFGCGVDGIISKGLK
jgi:hypothetical protein